MSTKICVTCSKSFEANDYQEYCSSACKQQAYRKRKEEQKEKQQSFRVSLEEYEKVLKTTSGEKYKGDFLKYCFIRRNLPENITFERLILFIENNFERFDFLCDPERGNMFSAWISFQQKFLSGEIPVVETYQD